jgi:hypothetical protein
MLLESNQISQGEENIINTHRLSSENLTDEDHDSDKNDQRDNLENTANVGVSLKRDTENLYYAQKDYSKFLSGDMRAISPTSAQGEEDNQIGVQSMRRSVRKNPETSLFDRRYSAYETKSQKFVNLDQRKNSYDHTRNFKLSSSNYNKYREHFIDPEEEDFNEKDMLESADLDNTITEKEF